MLLACIGLLTPPTALADQVNGLYAKAYGNPSAPAVVFDQRGCGRSEEAAQNSFTFANAVRDVKTVFEHFHLSKAIVVGHSYGGTLAIKYALAHPTDVRSVVLIDAPLDQPGVATTILDRSEEAHAMSNDLPGVVAIQQLRRDFYQTGVDKVTPELGGALFAFAVESGLYVPKFSSLSRDRLWAKLWSGPAARLMSQLKPEPFAGLILNDRWLMDDLVPALKTLGTKIDGLFGADDGLFSPQQLKRIERALPPGHFDLAVDASHNLLIDRQDEFLSFLDEVDEAVPR